MSTETYLVSKQLVDICSQLDIIFELRNSKKFCDVTLVVEGKKFLVHKVILASSVPYFRKMFSNDKYQECNETEIKLSGLDPEIMNSIFAYIYGRRIKVTNDKLIDILHHADYLMMKDLKGWVEKTLMNTVTEETYIAHFLLSRRFKMPALNNKIQLFFKKNSPTMNLKQDFFKLSKEEFSDLWSKAGNGERAYLSLMKWVKYDLDNRKESLHELLKRIPPNGISLDFFKSNIKTEALLKENLQCSLWVVDLVTFLANKADTAHKAEVSKKPNCSYCQPRT